VHPSDLADDPGRFGRISDHHGAGGARTLPLEDFFITPGTTFRKENVLKDGEIVTEIQIPAPSPLHLSQVQGTRVA